MSVPENRCWWFILAQDFPTIGGLLFVLNVLQIVVLQEEAGGGVGWRVRVTKPRDHFPRFCRENFGTVTKRHEGDHLGALADIKQQSENNTESRKTKGANLRLQAFGFTRSRDHFRRWRFASGERSSQWISSGQRGSHLQR